MFSILINRQPLDLPADTELNVQQESVFFRQEGSYSLPLTLPDTDNNKQLLGFIHRLDVITDNKEHTLDCLFINNYMQQPARLLILSYTRGEGFEVSLLLGDSSMWSLFRDVTLKQVLYSYTYAPATTANLQQDTDTPVMQIDLTTPGGGDTQVGGGDNKAGGGDLEVSPGDGGDIRPVDPDDENKATDPDRSGGIGTTTDDNGFSRFNGENEKASDTLLDDIYNRLTNGTYNMDKYFEVCTIYTPRGFINPPDSLNNHMRKIDENTTEGRFYIDDEDIVCPVGLGYTAFLHLDFVLEACFKYIGKTLTLTPPTSVSLPSDYLRRILILNQTIDALIPGRIYFDTLVPDVPVTDLLQSMFALFGMQFFEDGDSVRAVYLQDVLTDSSPSTALQDKAILTGIEFADQSSLQIAPEHVRLEEDNEINTPEDLAAFGELPAPGERLPSAQNTTAAYGKDFEAGDLYLKQESDAIYVVKTKATNAFGANFSDQLVCQNQTDYLHPAKILSTDKEYDLTEIDAPFADTRVCQNTVLMPGMENRTCTVKMTTVKLTASGQTTETKDTTCSDECPLVFGFYQTPRNIYLKGSGTYAVAAVLPVYYWVQPENALHAEGIAKTMHAAYEAALRDGAHTVSFTASLSQQEIDEFRFDKVYIIDGVRLLLLSYECRYSGNRYCEVDLKMMKLP